MRSCKACTGNCIILSVDCFREESFYFTQAITSKEVRKAMNKAAKTYIIPLLTQTCYTELCTAILNSELDPLDPAYEELSESWETLIDQLTDLLVAAVEYQYISIRGFGVLAAKGFELNDSLKDIKLWDSFISTLKTQFDAVYSAFKVWIEDKTNRDNYSCLPTIEESDTCDEEEDDFDDDWTTLKSDPYGNRRYL